MNKIITLNQLEQIKRDGKKLVLCGGCFDIFHVGHLRFLESAKKIGGILLVALESDEKVKILKGKNRPIHSQKERAEILANLTIVDYVVLLPYFKTDADYFSLIKKIKPDVIAVTQGDPVRNKKEQQIKTVGGKIVVVPNIKTPSTTQLTKLLGID